MLIDDMKRRMMAALKAKNEVEKKILGVAIGDIQMAEARGGDASDATAVSVIRKLVKSNEETLSATTDPGQKAILTQELEVLRSFLPQTLDVDAIVSALAPIREELRAAANDGQATGIAMKHLKATGANVAGKDVTEAVKRVRA